MGKRKTVSVGNGEFIIGPDAIYTFAHYYMYPDTGRQVVCVGMDHFADTAYFDVVREILRPCDLVLFEDVSAARLTPEAKSAILAWTKGQIFSDSLDGALLATAGGAYCAMAIMLHLHYEGDSFVSEHSQPHWVNVDLFTDTKVEEEFFKTLEKRLGEVSPEHKQRLVAQARHAMAGVESGELSVSALRDFLISVEFDEIIDRIMFDVMVAPRNTHCMEEFDRLARTSPYEFIGIKFGTHHIYSLRASLEERGYLYQNSRRLQALALT